VTSSIGARRKSCQRFTQRKPQVFGRFGSRHPEPRQVTGDLRITVSGSESAAISVAITIMYSSSGRTKRHVNPMTRLRTGVKADDEPALRSDSWYQGYPYILLSDDPVVESSCRHTDDALAEKIGGQRHIEIQDVRARLAAIMTSLVRPPLACWRTEAVLARLSATASHDFRSGALGEIRTPDPQIRSLFSALSRLIRHRAAIVSSNA
jgi:hypothetical protein